jgi:hypothetical protein
MIRICITLYALHGKHKKGWGGMQISESLSERPTFESTLGVLLSHPTRVAAYVIFVERTASPAEIAKVIGKDVGHVGYHVRKLLDLNQIELVDEKPVRGAVEHFYKAITRPFCGEKEWAAMTPAERGSITRQTLQLHQVDIAQAIDADTFDSRTSRWLLRLPIQDMDDEGFDEMADAHARLYEESLEVMGRVANRKSVDPAHETFPAVMTSMFFERAPRKA